MQPIKMLLVEDSSADVMLVKHALRDSGISTEQMDIVNSVDKARHMLDDNRYDIVFLDYILGGDYGTELFEYIDINYTDVIMLSGTKDIKVMEVADKLGARMFFDKPLDKGKLETVVQELGGLSWAIVKSANA